MTGFTPKDDSSSERREDAGRETPTVAARDAAGDAAMVGALDAGNCQGRQCGVGCPTDCGIGEQCVRNADCESGVCNGTCLPAGCGNDLRDEGETDVDCGGSCDPCVDGKRCLQDPHCQSKVCDDGYCKEPACDDETRNGGEVDVDCGGDCKPCLNGSDCNQDKECASGFCHDGACTDAACTDATRNGSETDEDCGGSCNPCDDERLCKADEDCKSHYCSTNDDGEKRCVPASCEDERRNGSETDEDCGGSCDPCPDEAHCEVPTDCVSVVCGAADDKLVCLAPTCEDERQNGAETGKDCGGASACGRCPDGQGCDEHADCASNSCIGSECAPATCNDERLNQDEVAVDCGGKDCRGCPFGTPCSDSDDCLSERCDDTCLRGGFGTACRIDEDCMSNLCEDDSCAKTSPAGTCVEDVDCLSEACSDDETCAPSGVSRSCRTDTDCASGRCDESEGECLPSSYEVKTDSGAPGDQQITFNAWVRRSDADAALAWKDFAMLYFFTPEEADNLWAAYYWGPNQTDGTLTFLAREVTDAQWAFIWRVRSDNNTTIPTTEMSRSIEFQLHHNPPETFDDLNDYSYSTGTKVDNPRVVVCLRLNGLWIHTQGVAPEFAPDPCGLIIDECPNGETFRCDVLERKD